MRRRGETILGLARDLHVSLAAGNIGRTTIRWCDLAALVLLVSGLTLWWPKRSLRLRRLDGTRRPWSELHNFTGALSLIFLFVAVSTGAVISFESPLRTVMGRFTANEPAHSAPFPPTPQNKPFLTPDRALVLASAVVRGAHAAQMTMPEYGGTYRFSMIEPHRFSGSTEQNISLDPWSGAVIYISQGASTFPSDRIFAANEALHTGDIFGWPGRILMALASLMLLPQALSGLIMFWKRRQNSADRRTHPLKKGSLV